MFDSDEDVYVASDEEREDESDDDDELESPTNRNNVRYIT